MPPALELFRISKHFGDVLALDDVTLSLAPGTVHGVLGENGAGKSTLMNVAYGLLRPDRGEIRSHGAPLALRSPNDAIAAGIGMVHQHFMLAGALSVLDNVLLGDRRVRQFPNRRELAHKLAAMSTSLGLPIEPTARVDTLSVGRQQRVEILKALWRDVRVLILDEPTAVLTPMETDQLFAAVERLRSEGRTIVFISHKLGEVKRICDRVTILRRGKVAWEGAASETSAEELATVMVGGTGNSFDLPVKSRQHHGQANALASATLSLIGVCAYGVDDVTLDVPPGQILGVAGVDGNGQQELAEAIVGLRPISSGSIRLGDIEISRLPARRRMQMGLAHIPNDRKREALVGAASIIENIALKRPPARFGVLNRRKGRQVAADLRERFDIRAASVDVPVATLSGGNQQKVVLARELNSSNGPRVIVAMNPVRGLDIAATRFVYEQLRAAQASGCAILLISSELDELLELADRIGVLYRGRLTMTSFPDASRDHIGRLMAGIPSTSSGQVA